MRQEMLDRRIGIRAVTLCFDANGGLRRRRWPQTGYGYARTGVSASLAQIEASLSFHRKICLLKTDLSDGDRLADPGATRGGRSHPSLCGKTDTSMGARPPALTGNIFIFTAMLACRLRISRPFTVFFCFCQEFPDAPFCNPFVSKQSHLRSCSVATCLAAIGTMKGFA